MIKYTDATSPSTVKLKDIMVRGTFLDENGDLCIKLPCDNYDYVIIHSQEGREGVYVDNNVKVTPVNVDIVVTNDDSLNTVSVELTHDEVEALSRVINRIGGCPYSTGRKYIKSVGLKIGSDQWTGSQSPRFQMTGGIEFK